MRHIAAVVLATFVAMGVCSPAMSDVKRGVDAWEQGDYAAAVKEWRPLAQAGDPDAQFNLGQAYKLGRGVPVDLSAALDWYRKAAVQGHARAEDNYGLLLFQQNRRVEAMPFLQHAAERGEPRAQYIVGTALFNGDLLARDWVRAYALMTRASAAGLPQANGALLHMEKYIPEGQRAAGAALAAAIEDKEQEQQAKLAGMPLPAAPPQARALPRSLRPAQLPPSHAPAGTPPLASASTPAPAPAPAPSAPAPVSGASAPVAKGEWRIQLGAFSEASRAERQWNSISSKVQGLLAYQHYLVPGGAVTRLQAGPFTSREDAGRLCAAVKVAGADCIVKSQ